jgi:hypothetical protein
MFDVTFEVLLDDLAARGLLDETLVVVVGEFGRTPRINRQGGRDHWGHVFSMALAGAGIRGGQVIGASDKNGAYPTTDPVRGGDLTATIFHLLGIDPGGIFHDRTNRPHPLTKGEPIAAALGLTPATTARTQPGGDLAFVPPYDPSPILDTAFDPRRPFVPAAPPSRDTGWRADPPAGGLVVRKDNTGAFLGWAGGVAVAAGARAVLGQEIRNARGGRYTFTVRAAADAASAEEFEAGFLANASCRLVLFRFRDATKDVRAVDELAAADFRPTFGAAGVFRVERFLASTTPGANFAIGNGLGVAVVVTATRALTPAARAGVRVVSAEVAFSPAPRFDNDDL